MNTEDIDTALRVVELLKCPVCLDDMYPPILQCSNGHPLCSECKSRVDNKCPTCRNELEEDIRCIILDKSAESLEVPCKYHIFGCVGIFSYLSKLNHENGCAFRPYNCPYAVGSDCKVTGNITYLVKHLKDDHGVGMNNADVNIFVNIYVQSNPHEINNEVWAPLVACCFGQYFLLHFEAFQLQEVPVYIAFLRFMGEKNEANKYCYSLEVEAKEGKLGWQGKPRSISESHSKVRDSCEGLIIQRDRALFISGGNQMELNLCITTRIWKKHEFILE